MKLDKSYWVASDNQADSREVNGLSMAMTRAMTHADAKEKKTQFKKVVSF